MTEKQDTPQHGVTQMEGDQRVFDLYDEYCHGHIDRREFLKRASALTVVGVSGPAMAQALLPPFAAPPGPVPAPVQPPTFELNINNGTWPGWPDTKRVNMEYSNCHQHTNGRQLEFAFAQHHRAPADHTSVRWTDFTASGAPTQGYYWPENDYRIWETDNIGTHYIPWKQWVCLWNLKVIDIATPAAIVRWPSAAEARTAWQGEVGISLEDTFDVVLSGGATARYVNNNANPACLVNPDGNFTCSFGGGGGTSYANGRPPNFKLIDDNPNYPATSSKPLRLRCWVYGTFANTPSPGMTRHAVKVGDWIYWGGGFVSDSATRFKEFYRIYVPDLLNSQIVTQERITDPPLTNPYARLPCLAADVPRKRLIFINVEGVFMYQIPANDGADGVWTGPYNVSDWANTISDGRADGVTGGWHGFIGTHRTDLNQTFFRYNLSRKWNRVIWHY